MSGRLGRGCVGLLLTVTANWLITPAAEAQGLVKEWSQVQIPPMPPIKQATVDPTTTALFIISMTLETCEPVKRARCAATVPGIAKLLQAAARPSRSGHS